MRELAKLGIRLFAVYNAITFLTLIPPFLSAATIEGYIPIGFYFALLIPLAIASVLWFFAEPFAKIMVKDKKDLIAHIDTRNLYKAAIAIIGLILIVFALPDLANSITYYVTNTQSPAPLIGKMFQSELFAAFTGSLVSIVVGLILFFGANGISKSLKLK